MRYPRSVRRSQDVPATPNKVELVFLCLAGNLMIAVLACFLPDGSSDEGDGARAKEPAPLRRGFSLLPDDALPAQNGVAGRSSFLIAAEMPTKFFNDPEHWRTRAEEARVQAEDMADPVARRSMLDIAAQYERLAQRAEERTGLEKKRPPAPSVQLYPHDRKAAKK